MLLFSKRGFLCFVLVCLITRSKCENKGVNKCYECYMVNKTDTACDKPKEDSCFGRGENRMAETPEFARSLINSLPFPVQEEEGGLEERKEPFITLKPGVEFVCVTYLGVGGVVEGVSIKQCTFTNSSAATKCWQINDINTDNKVKICFCNKDLCNGLNQDLTLTEPIIHAAINYSNINNTHTIKENTSEGSSIKSILTSLAVGIAISLAVQYRV